MILRNIPNALTLTRLILIAPFLMFLYQQEYVNAFYTFILAGFTDGLDGWLARYFRWQTPFGRFIDPMADKLLIASSFVALALTKTLPWWLVVLVFSRDLTISVGVLAWYRLIKQEPDFNPTYLSKINTVLQLALVTLCLFELAYPLLALNLLHVTTLLLILTTITTTGSYIDYVWTWGKKACAMTRAAK